MLDLIAMNDKTLQTPEASPAITYYQFTPAGWRMVEGNAIPEIPVTLTVNGEDW